MNIIDNWKNVIEKARKLDAKSLEAIRIGIFVVIVADIFGLWWFLGVKKLAMALLIFLIIGLVIVLLLERKLPPKPIKKIKKEEKPKMEEKPTQEEEYKDLTPEQPVEDEGMFGNMDLGIPNAEEFQERAERALGTF